MIFVLFPLIYDEQILLQEISQQSHIIGKIIDIYVKKKDELV